MAGIGTPRFLLLSDVAEILNTSVAQVTALVKRKELRAIQIGGRRQWRVEVSELESYIQRMYAEADTQLENLEDNGYVDAETPDDDRGGRSGLTIWADPASRRTHTGESGERQQVRRPRCPPAHPIRGVGSNLHEVRTDPSQGPGRVHPVQVVGHHRCA